MPGNRTDFAGNAVATVLVGTWVGEFDEARAERVLAGDWPFDEATMLDEDSTDNDREPVGIEVASGGRAAGKQA